jgi:hypothetical protein
MKEIKELANEIDREVYEWGWSKDAHTMILALLDMIKKTKSSKTKAVNK